MNETDSKANSDTTSQASKSLVKTSSRQPCDERLPAETSVAIKELLEQLVALEQTITGINGLEKWNARLNRKFHIVTDEPLPIEESGLAIQWLRNRLSRVEKQIKRRKALLSARERREPLYEEIKQKMRLMTKEVGKEAFYKEIAHSLRLKKSFTSLTNLSDKDLIRVAEFVAKLPNP